MRDSGDGTSLKEAGSTYDMDRDSHWGAGSDRRVFLCLFQAYDRLAEEKERGYGHTTAVRLLRRRGSASNP